MFLCKNNLDTVTAKVIKQNITIIREETHARYNGVIIKEILDKKYYQAVLPGGG